MKTKKSIIITASALIGACSILGACGGGGNSGGGNNRDGNSLVGDWVSQEYDGAFVYTFKDNGSGNYDAAGVAMPFTYTIDGDKLSILYEGDTDPFETTYKVSGNTLTIKDSFDADVVYNKK